MKKNKLIKYILIIIIFITIISIIVMKKIYNKKNIYIMSWNGTLDSTLIEKFEKIYNVKVHIKYYSSNEELISKLSIYNKNIDIIFPSDYIINELLKKKLIIPIDINKIKNFKHIIPDLLKKISHNKKYYGIPISWGIFGIASSQNINKKIENSSDIYKIFFTGKNNQDSFRIAVINDMPTMTNITYQYYKNNFKKNKIYNKKNLFTIIYEILMEQKKNVVLYTYDDYLEPLFTHNIIDIALIESYKYLKIMNNNPSLNLKFLFSNYYILKSCEYIAISNNSQNQELCYQFINFMLENEQVLYSNKTDFSFTSRKDLLYETTSIAKEILEKIEKNKKITLFTEDILNKKELIALWMKIKS